MKKALISPIEPRNDSEGNEGYRVAFVCEEEFDVASPLFWVDCPDSCVQDMWVYVNGQLVDITPPPLMEEPPLMEDTEVVEENTVVDTLIVL